MNGWSPAWLQSAQRFEASARISQRSQTRPGWYLCWVGSTVRRHVCHPHMGRFTDTSDEEDSEEGDSSDGDFGRGGGRRPKRLRGKAERSTDAVFPLPLPRLNDALPQKASHFCCKLTFSALTELSAPA